MNRSLNNLGLVVAAIALLGIVVPVSLTLWVHL